MNKVKIMAVAAALLVFIGCASGPAVMDKSIPEEQRATLYLVGKEYSIKSVDGKSIPGAFGIFAADTKGTGHGAFKKELKPTAQIPSGEHEIAVDVGLFVQKAKHNFESGKKYRIAYEGTVESIKPEVRISEITGEIPKE